jgi:hypothetical protein
MTPAVAIAILEAAKPTRSKTMSELIPRIGQNKKIELIDDKMVRIAGIDPMTPMEAAFLARSLLACAAVISLEASPKINSLCADVHFPILKWAVSAQTGTQNPVLIFSIPPGIDVTFQMTVEIEKQLGAALVGHAEGDQPPVQPPDRLQ